jgi:hypothetical protein
MVMDCNAEKGLSHAEAQRYAEKGATFFWDKGKTKSVMFLIFSACIA